MGTTNDLIFFNREGDDKKTFSRLELTHLHPIQMLVMYDKGSSFTLD